MATLNWTQNLSKSSERALALETYLSYQKDHSIVGPLTQDGWRSSLDPTGGFMLSELDFLWDLNTFPIDRRPDQQLPDRAAGQRRRPLPVERCELRPDLPVPDQRLWRMCRRTAPTSVRPDAGFPGEESGGPGGNGVITRCTRKSG